MCVECTGVRSVKCGVWSVKCRVWSEVFLCDWRNNALHTLHSTPHATLYTFFFSSGLADVALWLGSNMSKQ